MAKKIPTTTPTNKKDGTAKVKPSGGKVKPLGSEKAHSGSLATIGDAVAAKREERNVPREVRIENFTRRLPCKLTDAERSDALQEIQFLRDSIDRKEKALEQHIKDSKSAKESFENQIAADQMRREELIEDVCKGIVCRDTNCQRVFDYPLIQYREIRTDTTPPTTLIERPLNNAELQMPLDLTPSNVSTVHDDDDDDDDGIIDDTEEGGEIDY